MRNGIIVVSIIGLLFFGGFAVDGGRTGLALAAFLAAGLVTLFLIVETLKSTRDFKLPPGALSGFQGKLRSGVASVAVAPSMTRWLVTRDDCPDEERDNWPHVFNNRIEAERWIVRQLKKDDTLKLRVKPEESN